MTMKAAVRATRALPVLADPPIGSYANFVSRTAALRSSGGGDATGEVPSPRGRRWHLLVGGCDQSTAVRRLVRRERPSGAPRSLRLPLALTIAVLLFAVGLTSSAAAAPTPCGNYSLGIEWPNGAGLVAPLLDIHSCTLSGPWSGTQNPGPTTAQPPRNIEFTAPTVLTGTASDGPRHYPNDPECQTVTKTLTWRIPVRVSGGADPTMSFPGATSRLLALISGCGSPDNTIDSGDQPYKPFTDHPWSLSGSGSGSCSGTTALQAAQVRPGRAFTPAFADTALPEATARVGQPLRTSSLIRISQASCPYNTYYGSDEKLVFRKLAKLYYHGYVVDKAIDDVVSFPGTVVSEGFFGKNAAADLVIGKFWGD